MKQVSKFAHRPTSPTRIHDPSATRPAIRAGFHIPPVNERRYRPSEVLLDVSSTISAPSFDVIARRHGLTRLETYRVRLTGRTIYRLHIDDGRSVQAVIRALADDARLVGAQPNFTFKLQEAVRPSVAARKDPVQYVVSKLHLDEAHKLATGKHVLVAVIDTGIDTSHPYLKGTVAARFNPLGGANTPDEHGTAMAGAIAEHGDLTGVAPGARLLSVRAFAPRSSSEGTTFGIIRGIDWAVDRGARIINMSFAGPRDPGLEPAITAAHGKGIVLVAAVGNTGPRSGPQFPAADPHVIAVTATDVDDKLFDQAVRGSYIAVAAPGVDVLAPTLSGAVKTVTGTSIAAAEVSGVIALLIEIKPSLKPDDIRGILMATAVKPDPHAEADQFGAGLVDAIAAIRSLGSNPTADDRVPKTN